MSVRVGTCDSLMLEELHRASGDWWDRGSSTARKDKEMSEDQWDLGNENLQNIFLCHSVLHSCISLLKIELIGLS